MSSHSKDSKTTQLLKVPKMISDEKSPCTPAETTRPKQGATKQKWVNDISYTKFNFLCLRQARKLLKPV